MYMTDPHLNLNDPNNTTSGLGGGALVADLDGFNLNGTGVLIPQTDTSTASFAGSYAFGAQAYNNSRDNLLGWEFDFVGQASVSSVAFGRPPDSSAILSSSSTPPPDGTDTATFSGTAASDHLNPGRYTIKLSMALMAMTPLTGQLSIKLLVGSCSGSIWMKMATVYFLDRSSSKGL